MTRAEKRILWGLGALILALSLMEAMVPDPTDWRPSYSRFHRKPFGAELVHERLTDLFPEVISVNERPGADAYTRSPNEAIGSPVNHVFIDRAFVPDINSAERLLELARAGDRVFIAAEHIGGPLGDSLRLVMDAKPWDPVDTVSDIRFVGDPRIAEGVFRYARGFPGAYFTAYDSARTRVLAVDGSANPVLLEYAWGRGGIVLCSAPMALTNYHLLKGRNATFIAGAFSVLPVRPVLWDEAYKGGRAEARTPMRYILSQPALRWAWFLALALVVLYMLVFARRQQRAIPILAEPRNASRELLHTLGRLYWHKGDHPDLANKMIAHFKDDVRQYTYLRTFDYEGGTIDHLTAKTGLERQEVADRLNAIARRENAGRLSEKDLLELSNELHELRRLIR